MVLTPPRIIECFHLGLLSVLSRELGPGEFVLKGGANLRYFHGSSRYSEDIDLDVIRLKSWQVKEKVDRALGSQTLRILLRADGLETGEFSAPKQTETTQRWKVAILARGRQDPVRTKIELSHRAVDPRFALDAVPESVVSGYAIRPPTVQHYLAEAAIEQKVLALAGRSQTQARDVFDLDLLLRNPAATDPAAGVPADTRNQAGDRAMELPYEAYRDQVLPFLEPEISDLIDDKATWEGMQAFVAGKLEASDVGN